jgi:hypothetical protein
MRSGESSGLENRRDPRFEIAAEASSEIAREPSYDELWREPRRAPSPRASQERRPDRLPVAAALVAMIFSASALIGLRDKIVRLAPPAAPVFAAVGLPINPTGLELRDLRSRIMLDGARKILAIEGEIVNLRREANRVPPVLLTVRGENGLDRYAWTTQPPKSRLEPGEKIAFRARLASPPADGADVLVRFSKIDETPVGTVKK